MKKRLFKEGHWANHDELLRRLSKEPQVYLALTYWVAYTIQNCPIFFITDGAEPVLGKVSPEGVPYPSPWLPETVIATEWTRLNHPCEAEAILSQCLRSDGPVTIEADVHWSYQAGQKAT